MSVVRPDPKIRKDGLCACGCRKLVRTDRWQRYVSDMTDPFASSECCRRWHGVPLPSREQNHSNASRLVQLAKLYSMADGLPNPVGETMTEARRRDTEARERLGLGVS